VSRRPLRSTTSRSAASNRRLRLWFISVRRDGSIETAHELAGKRSILASLCDGDVLLVVRSVRMPDRVQVLVVDDLDPGREALA